MSFEKYFVNGVPTTNIPDELPGTEAFERLHTPDSVAHGSRENVKVCVKRAVVFTAAADHNDN